MAAAKTFKKVNLLDSDEEYSDDEATPLTRPGIDEIKPWDPFRTMPPEDLSGSLASKKTVEAFASVAKVFAYILTFAILLTAAVISKGTLLFMTSQIKINKDDTYGAPQELCKSPGGRTMEAKGTMEERVAWVWCLFFCFAVPEFFMWFRSTRIVLFRTWKTPPTLEFILLTLLETVHVLGLAMFVYIVLPNLKVVEAVMLMHCVCVIPGILNIIARSTSPERRYLLLAADVGAILAQFSGLFVWAGLKWSQGIYELVWVLPVSLFLVSFGWWENYVDKSSSLGLMKYLTSVKDNLKATRYFTYIFLSIWKIIAFFGFMLAIEWILVGGVDHLFTLFTTSFDAHNVTQTEKKLPGDFVRAPGQDVREEPLYAPPSTASYVFAIQASMSLICFLAGKFACKIRIQGFSFALPINLAVPTTIVLLVTFCSLKMGNSCMFTGSIPIHLFFNCAEGGYLIDVLTYDCAWLWMLWLLSQAWITGHIWTPKCGRLASTEKLFVHPFYNSLVIEQSMAMNRRRDDEKEVMTGDIRLDKEDLADVEINNEYGYDHSTSGSSDNQDDEESRANPGDSITRIYTCATMWHETREEIITFLKSILYLDEDQSARRVAQKYLKVVDPDYYEIETHIFFDDAFELSDDDEEEMVVNSYVRLLVESMDEAASYVHQINVRIAPPKKIPTPYGGRLVWTLPGKTKIICHLKDKQKIRNRKRWSQVMYMYYLLGHKLMELPISIDRKAVIAQHTYLLALDGDIDFVPDAVQLLIDLMKRNPNLGAACGRIHPVGSGLMAWYQKFEYAIGHWLQKATEHMIGCVLCSPGCFSLFRGKALMDDNVMAKYTTRSCEARHYVQYDQGEDRWLCTLLLQRGYRVEYCAASDAYTHCPEGFDEFYNQRRRWVPSTMANIMDLLGDYKRTIKVNDNISFLYICYHILLMVGTILGPGTIFLMIVGSFNVAFGMDNWTSFWINLFPIIGYIIVCMTTKAKFQVLVAQLLSTFYAIVMMAVLVGIVLQLSEDGIASPSGIFLLMTAFSFIIAALLHPQEFWCLPTGVIYYLTVPSMYLLLIIYSVCNLNNVSWGTREAPVKKRKTQQDNQAAMAAAAAAQKKNKGNALLSFFQLSGEKQEDEGSLEFSFAGLFKLMCCVHRKPDSAEKLQLMAISDSLTALAKRLDSIDRSLNPGARSSTRTSSGSRRSFSRSSVRSGGIPAATVNPLEPNLNVVNENDDEDDDGSLYSDGTVTESEMEAKKEERNNLINPYWVEDKALNRGRVDYITGNETKFWQDLIDKYLFPIDEDKAEQAKIAAALKDLRNKSVFTFFILNALYVTVVFLLTLQKDKVHIRWPLGVTHNITYTHSGSSVTPAVLIESQYLQLEPIGMVFVLFFATIMVIQFIAMLFHRFGTFSQILASTEIKVCNKRLEEISQEAILNKHAIDIARDLQQLKGLNNEECEDYGPNEPVGRRRTVHNLERQTHKPQAYTSNLQNAFRTRLNSIAPDGDFNDAAFKSIRRETLALLTAGGGRRSTLAQEIRRRSSVGISAYEAQRAARRRSTLDPSHEDSENSD